jgi:23S rRNA pseudouridine955/2504/2580 synthase
MQEIIVPTAETAKKVENFLKKKFPIGYVRKLFRRKAVRINGQRGLPDDVVRPGDRIELAIRFDQDRGDGAQLRRIPEIRVIYENTDLVVVNKPAGIAVHEARGLLNRETLLGVLEAKYKGSGVRPRLVHRIDKDTSGTLLVAKTEATAESLERLFETGEIEKEYLCLVVGRLPRNQGRIDFPLPGRDGGTVPALTRFSVLERFSETTLLRVSIETGRMHQIRLHLAKLGYPVVGDAQHGDFAFNKRFRREFGLKRQFLHAAKLSLSYLGKRLTWSAPVPADLDRTLTRLRADFKPGRG